MLSQRRQTKVNIQKAGKRNEMLANRERDRFVKKVCEDPSFGCYYRVEQDLEVPRSSVRYWVLKSQDRDFHGLTCGGNRHKAIKDWEKPIVQQYVVEYLNAFPYSNLKQLASELCRCFERNVTPRV